MALLVGCCIVTVKRQLRVLRRLGFINWKRRLKRVGGSTEQTSNAYILTLPLVHASTALEQKEREVSSNINLSLSSFISLKDARAKHNIAKKGKIKSACTSCDLAAKQEHVQNSTLSESDYERKQRSFEEAYKLKMSQNRSNWGRSDEVGDTRAASIDDEYARLNVERQLKALGHSKTEPRLILSEVPCSKTQPTSHPLISLARPQASLVRPP